MRAAVFALLFAIPCFARAQQAAAPPRFASIVGAGVDSVRGGYLKGAIVAVSGTARSAVTDSAGRFRIDSVPPGNRYVEVMHPLLDSLALTVRTPSRELKAGDTTVVFVGIPSAATIVATKCSAVDRERGAAALVGFVLDADTDAPAPGATVTVRWMDYQLGNRSINRTPQVRTGIAGADGSYRVCGIPDDLTTGATAHRGADTTGAVPANFVVKLAVASFRIPSSSIAAAAASPVAATPRARPIGRAVLRGRVVDASGAPVPAARVALDADESVTTTNDAGEFTLAGLRAGTREISVRRIGFEAIERAVEVDRRTPGNVTLQLNKFVPVLETVRVSALRDLGLQRVGFEQRQRTGAGKYISPAEIEKRNPLRLNYLLEGITSLRTGVNSSGQRYVTGRFGDCLTYFVDGRRWFSGGGGVEASPDYWLSASELGAVEVYTAGFAPGEFMGFGSDGRPCTSIVIWTKWKLRI
ncbi:MAG TPA: carboxypeptidase-like regulatory domain-containing protein [Gemmatimonadaceae bacterium]|nr:carboxypeptidase-like regulatory domain-containing protein [Gemmatimonadaceae bacterium]